MYETQKEFDKWLMKWRVSIGHEKEVKPKGNFMTEQYYTKRLLLVYIDALHKLRVEEYVLHQDWLLLEGGDLSHGLASQLKNLCTLEMSFISN
jgi:hypothetical protein